MPLTARLPRQLWILAFALAAAGCHSSDLTEISYETGPNGTQAGYVRITPTATGLTVANQTERPIYLMAVNAELLALLDWVPCTATGPTCSSLAAGEQREIPWASVLGYSANTKQYTVYWWHSLVMPDGTLRPEEVHNVTVTR